MIAARPCFVTPRKEWPHAAARMASKAISNDPSVPFLKPIGKDKPDANSLWSWLSVVLAPTAPNDNKSAKNYINIFPGVWVPEAKLYPTFPRQLELPYASNRKTIFSKFEVPY